MVTTSLLSDFPCEINVVFGFPLYGIHYIIVTCYSEAKTINTQESSPNRQIAQTSKICTEPSISQHVNINFTMLISPCLAIPLGENIFGIVENNDTKLTN